MIFLGHYTLLLPPASACDHTHFYSIVCVRKYVNSLRRDQGGREKGKKEEKESMYVCMQIHCNYYSVYMHLRLDHIIAEIAFSRSGIVYKMYTL